MTVRLAQKSGAVYLSLPTVGYAVTHKVTLSDMC